MNLIDVVDVINRQPAHLCSTLTVMVLQDHYPYLRALACMDVHLLPENLSEMDHPLLTTYLLLAAWLLQCTAHMLSLPRTYPRDILHHLLYPLSSSVQVNHHHKSCLCPSDNRCRCLRLRSSHEFLTFRRDLRCHMDIPVVAVNHIMVVTAAVAGVQS